MATDKKKRSLGRGLDALFKESKIEEEKFTPKIKRADEIVSNILKQQSNEIGLNSQQDKIAIEKLKPGKFQPRRKFNDQALDNLANSISVHGILQPLLVRPLLAGNFEIIAGERRWRAAQKAQIHELPVVILDLDDNDTLEIALIENLQREDLSILEEAAGYQRLIDEFHHTQDALAKHLGKSRSHVTNILRLLKLSDKVKLYLESGELTVGHARAIINCKNADDIANIIIKRGLTVRQTERLVKASASKKTSNKTTKRSKNIWKDVDVLALEKRMSSLLGMSLTIDSQEDGKGNLFIKYKSLEQLDDVLERLSQTPL